jgi:integrase
MTRFYNQHIKEEYLNEFNNEGTRTVIGHMFTKSKDIEEFYGKDLFDFSDDEIKKVLQATNPLTINTARSNGRYIAGYISWAIEPKGYRTNGNINPIRMKTPDWFEQFIDKSKKLYITEDELEMMNWRGFGGKLVNAQDAVIPFLSFYGVSGHSLSELTNLTKGDIDWDNGILHLKDERHPHRRLKIPENAKETVLNLIKKALSEKEYINKNGQSKGKNPIAKLVENDYVLKTGGSRVDNVGVADKHLIYRRVSTISNFFSLPYLNIKNMEKSGMIALAKNLYLERGKLENEELAIIAEQFGVRKVNMNGYEIYNYTILREFINADNIKELYDINIVE